MTGTFPLNVEIGSPQYTTVSQINYSAGTSASVQVTPVTSGTTPVSNSYYTFQSQDGQYWITGYVSNWTNNGGSWTADIIWSSSNTDTLPAQSICWCVWAKEYYDSLSASISTINNEIDTLTPKVDNSFVSATKTDDTTLRLTRNDGSTVDISFPESLSVRNVNLTSLQNVTANANELVVITGSFNLTSLNNKYLTITGLGYLQLMNNDIGNTKKVIAEFSGKVFYTNMPSGASNVAGLLYNGGKLRLTSS